MVGQQESVSIVYAISWEGGMLPVPNPCWKVKGRGNVKLLKCGHMSLFSLQWAFFSKEWGQVVWERLQSIKPNDVPCIFWVLICCPTDVHEENLCCRTDEEHCEVVLQAKEVKPLQSTPLVQRGFKHCWLAFCSQHAFFCQVIQAGAAVQWTSNCRQTVAIGSHWTPHPAQNVLLQDELKGWNTWEQFLGPCIRDEGGEMVLMLWVIGSELLLMKGLNRAALRF